MVVWIERSCRRHKYSERGVNLVRKLCLSMVFVAAIGISVISCGDMTSLEHYFDHRRDGRLSKPFNRRRPRIPAKNTASSVCSHDRYVLTRRRFKDTTTKEKCVTILIGRCNGKACGTSDVNRIAAIIGGTVDSVIDVYRKIRSKLRRYLKEGDSNDVLKKKNVRRLQRDIQAIEAGECSAIQVEIGRIESHPLISDTIRKLEGEKHVMAVVTGCYVLRL